VLFPILAKSLNTLLLEMRLLWQIGMQVESTKLMHVHLPVKQSRRKRVSVTPTRSIKVTKRLYDGVSGNSPAHRAEYTAQIIMLKIAVNIGAKAYKFAILIKVHPNVLL